MATKASSSSCFNFLKEALILPTRNPRLFAPIFLLTAVLLYLLILTNVLYIQPRVTEMLLEADKLRKMDPGSDDYAGLLEELRKEAMEIVRVVFAFFLVGIAGIYIKLIITVFATYTTCSGDRYSFIELLCKVIRKNLKGPAVTVAFVYVLEFTGLMLFVSLAMFLLRHSWVLSVLGLLLSILGFLFYLYFRVVCSVSVVVSVAEAGCHGPCALGRAWRLMKVRRKEAALLVFVTNLLPIVIHPLDQFAVQSAQKSLAWGLPILLAYALLVGGLQLFFSAADTVYYYECTESEGWAAHGYAKIPCNGEAHV